jgi:DNA repair protein RadC
VLRASTVELGEVAGLCGEAAALIRLAGEIASRLSDISEGLRNVLNDPREMERYLLARLRGMREEKLLLIFLNSQGVVLGEEILGAGTINQVVAFPRQIMEGCLRYRASALVVVHNHPHGPPLPSLQDREEAERLKEVLRPFDITVKDSIVVGHKRCFSIFRNSPL